MTNFTVKNHFKAENAKLVDATTYKDVNGTWYVELLYEYEDKSGIHRRYYPKVEFPFLCGKLPLNTATSLVIRPIVSSQRPKRSEPNSSGGSFCNPMSGLLGGLA